MNQQSLAQIQISGKSVGCSGFFVLLFLFIGFFINAASAADEYVPKMNNQPTWQRGKGDGFIVGLRVPQFTPEERKAYPLRIMFVLEYDKEGSERLPADAEWRQINLYERAINEELRRNHDGVLVFTYASDGTYQWIVYSRNNPNTEIMLFEAMAKVASPRKGNERLPVIEFVSENDPEWNYVDAYLTEFTLQ